MWAHDIVLPSADIAVSVNVFPRSVLRHVELRDYYSLVCTATEEESQKLQRLQSYQLALGCQELENRPYALLRVERGHHRRRMFRHEGYEHLEDVVEIFILEEKMRGTRGGTLSRTCCYVILRFNSSCTGLYLVHCRQIIENTLQLVVLYPVADHDELFQEQ